MQIRGLVTSQGGHKMMQKFPANLLQCDWGMILNFNYLLD